MMSNKHSSLIAFVPRCVVAKSSKTAPRVSANVSSLNQTETRNKNEEKEEDSVVKETSIQQRWPNPEEPVCIMCGKYGEYICDETDEDVCSLACKAAHLKNVGLMKQQVQSKQTDEDEVLDFEKHFQSTLQEVRRHVKNHGTEKHNFFCQKFNIRSKGANVPPLVLGFEDCGFDEKLVENLKENNYLHPTAVQMQSLPVGLNYRDMMVSATTSSGKTACFLLPMIRIVQQYLAPLPAIHPFRNNPLALILAPTRELCMQIEEQIRALCKGIQNIKTCLLVGGNPLPQQLYRLRHKVHIIVGTPGRINDVIDNHGNSLRLDHVKMVALDEVDVMLQMGFSNQIERILADVPPRPQYMMFSATIPRQIEQLAEKKMNNSVFVSVGQSGVTNRLVHQVILWVEDTSKRKKIFSIFREPKHFHPPVLVFVESRLGADMLSEAIKEKLHITCDSIHSDKTQSERNAILQNFITGGYKVLISTNVLGRGLDLPNVKQVIIFDLPNNIEDYIHQVGRAGRLFTQGAVMAFVNKSNKNMFVPLRELCSKSGTKLPDELINSPYMQIALDKDRKQRMEREKLSKKRKWTEDNLGEERNVTQKSLLDILRKNK